MGERQAGRFGARVEDVVAATPAAAAGLRIGDVITHVGGEAIHDDMDLIRRVSGLHADMSVTLGVLRGGDESRLGRPLEVRVTLSKKRAVEGRESFAESEPTAWRGMRVEYATATPQFREQSRDLDPGGCVGVVAVERDSAAWKAGLRPGDFVSHVGRERVATPRQFYEAAAVVDGDVSLRLTAVAAEKAVRTVAK
jgi:serine protease Do